MTFAIPQKREEEEEGSRAEVSEGAQQRPGQEQVGFWEADCAARLRLLYAGCERSGALPPVATRSAVLL